MRLNTFKYESGGKVLCHIKCGVGRCTAKLKTIEDRKNCVSESGNLYLIERQWLDEGWLGDKCPLADELTLI